MKLEFRYIYLPELHFIELIKSGVLYQMAIYLVNQGKTYKYEHKGGYIWSPKLNKAGNRNKGYELMKRVHKGDFILHNSGGKISSISVVQEDCKSCIQPKELKFGQNDYEWDDDGWIIYTDYYDFTSPIRTSDLIDWAITNYMKNSAFQIDGKLRLQYLCDLAEPHAKYLIEKVMIKERNVTVRRILQEAYTYITH